MTQTFTESDLADTLVATADVVVDTDALVRTIKRRARERRRVHVAVAGGVTAVLAIGAGTTAAALLSSGPTGSGTAVATNPVPTGTATLPAFTGDCLLYLIAGPLDVEPGHPIRLQDMDPTGRYIVGSYGPPVGPNGEWSPSDGATGQALPVRWDDGVGRVIPIAGEDINSVFVSGVNQQGAVVGGLRRNGSSAAWVSLDGTTWSLLPTPPGYDEASAIGISDNNEIVGYVDEGTAPAPAVWSAGPGDRWTARVIDVPDGVAGMALAITHDGLLVGILRGEPYVWDADGTARALPLPDGLTWGDVVDARGDWAVGFAPDGTEVAHVLRWNVRTGEVSTFEPELTGGVWGAAVNSRGDVAWTHQETYLAGSPELSTLLVTSDGQQYELPQPAGSEYGMPTPVALSDDATLIAGASGELWSC